MAMNKDFYRNLPGMVCIMLDKYITKYKKEPWFPEAWEEYRQHILNSSMDDMKMPGYVFNKYLKKETIKHFAVQDSRYELFHKDGDVSYGVPQQKKFPLPDADHVRSAIKFFNYVEPKYEAQLARAILKRAEMYNVDLSEMNIGDENRFKKYLANSELKHWGILGQKWGVRRFENPDGTLTEEGKKRYRRSLESKKEYESLYRDASAKLKDLRAKGTKSKTFKAAKYNKEYGYDQTHDIEIGSYPDSKNSTMLRQYIDELEIAKQDYKGQIQKYESEGDKFINKLLRSSVKTKVMDEKSQPYYSRAWAYEQLEKTKKPYAVDLANGTIYALDDNKTLVRYTLKK